MVTVGRWLSRCSDRATSSAYCARRPRGAPPPPASHAASQRSIQISQNSPPTIAIRNE